jgi:hypothetical protein
MAGERHGNSLACVNQTRQHYVNQMGKTQSNDLAERHGRGTACERHGMCESAFIGLCDQHRPQKSYQILEDCVAWKRL